MVRTPQLTGRVFSVAAAGCLLRRLKIFSDNQCRSQDLAISIGLHSHRFLAGDIAFSYSTTSCLAVPDHDNHLHNSMIAHYARRRLFREPMSLFVRMCREGRADGFTFSAVSKVCGEARDLVGGRMVHSRILRTGFAADLIVSNSIAAMYCKCGCFPSARKVFDDMPMRNAASWNVLMSGYAAMEGSTLNGEVRELLKHMGNEGLKCDDFTAVILLNLCSNGCVYGDCYGRKIHCFVIRNGLASDFASHVHVGSCLIDMYGKCDCVIAARRVFDSMECTNVVSWTAMINGYAKSGDFEKAFDLFRTMQVEHGLVPNHVSLLSVLSACRSFAGLLEGRQIHAFVIRSYLDLAVTMRNSLIDMYSKCGCMKNARLVFDAASFLNDQISWSSIISGYGLHGMGKEAIDLFSLMCETENKPDHVTSIGVLSACERAGLLTQGLEIYNILVTRHGILPTEELSSCVVGLLGRSGQLNQALNFIKSMPVEPGPSVWGALLDASVAHGNPNMQELACKNILDMEPDNASNYVSLSNLHASSGRWNVVGEIRSVMKEKGLKKVPGCSWITVDSKIYSFLAFDRSHPCSELIYLTLQHLVSVIRGNDICLHE